MNYEKNLLDVIIPHLRLGKKNLMGLKKSMFLMINKNVEEMRTFLKTIVKGLTMCFVFKNKRPCKRRFKKEEY